LNEGDKEVKKLKGSIRAFRNNVADKYLPAQKLHEAITYVVGKTVAATMTIDLLVASMSLTNAAPDLPRDRRVTMGGWMV
jgi:hypothetical protein